MENVHPSWRCLAEFTVAVAVAFFAGCRSSERADTRPAAALVSRPSTKQNKHLPYWISEMLVWKSHASDFYFVSVRARSRDIPTAIEMALTQLELARRAGESIETDGHLILDYHNATADSNELFNVRIGYRTKHWPLPWGEFRLGQLESLRVAAVLYDGPRNNIDKGYEALIAEIKRTHRKPCGETREIYLRPPDPNSPSVSIELQIGIE